MIDIKKIYTLYITVHEICPFPTITTKRPTFRYRLLYQRGQLSVGERLYQSVMPGFQPPRADAWVANQAVFGVKGCEGYRKHGKHDDLTGLKSPEKFPLQE